MYLKLVKKKSKLIPGGQKKSEANFPLPEDNA